MSSSTDSIKSDLGVISEADFAELRGIQKSHLRNERSQGKGPPYTRIGKTVFYPKKGVKKYLAEQTVVPKEPATLLTGRRGKKQQTAAA